MIHWTVPQRARELSNELARLNMRVLAVALATHSIENINEA